MKNRFVRFFSAVLVVCLLLTALPSKGFVGLRPLRAQAYGVGDRIQYGSYPQSGVTDEALIAKLNAVPKSWTSYDYYIGTGQYYDGRMETADYMKFADLFYSGTKYRAVLFSEYRPVSTGAQSDASVSYQDENGYFVNQTYYFKYEPIVWRVLDPENGIILADMILDSQSYQNTVYKYDNKYYRNTDCVEYTGNFATSTVCAWLNFDFYETAFTDAQKENIRCQEIQKKIVLLTYDDAKNEAYGFSSGTAADTSRCAKGTEYAKCQGLEVNSYSNGSSYWWLGSSYGYFYPQFVTNRGNTQGNPYANVTYKGVRPSCVLSVLKNDAEVSSELFSVLKGGVETTVTVSPSFSCFAGDTSLKLPGSDTPVPLSAHITSLNDSLALLGTNWQSSDPSVLEITGWRSESEGADDWTLYADFSAKKEGTVTVTVYVPGVGSAETQIVVSEKPSGLGLEPDLNYAGLYAVNGTLYNRNGEPTGVITARLRFTNNPPEDRPGTTLRDIRVDCSLTPGSLFANRSATYSFFIDELAPGESTDYLVAISPEDGADFEKDETMWSQALTVNASYEGHSVKLQADFGYYPANTLNVSFEPVAEDYEFKNGEICLDGENVGFVKGTLFVKNCAPDGVFVSFPEEMTPLLSLSNVTALAEIEDGTGMTFANKKLTKTVEFDLPYGEEIAFPYAFSLSETDLARRFLNQYTADAEEKFTFTFTSGDDAFAPVEMEASVSYHYDAVFMQTHLDDWDRVRETMLQKGFFYNTSTDSSVKLGACKAWEALGDLGKASKITVGGYELFVNYFDAYIADILLQFIETDLSDRMAEKVRDTLNRFSEFYSYYEDGLKTMQEWNDCVRESAEVDFLEFFRLDNDHMPSQRVMEVILDLANDDSSLKKTLGKMLYALDCSADIVDQLCKKVTGAMDIALAFREVYNAVLLANAYRDVMDDFYVTLECAAESMKSVDAKYAAAFSESVAKAKEKANINVSSVLSELLNSGKPLAELVYKQYFQKAVQSFVYLQVAGVCGLNVAGPVAATVFAYNTTYDLLDLFLKVGELTKQYEIMNHIAPIEYGLHKAVIDYYGTLTFARTYSAAVSMDAACRLMKLTNVYLYDAAYKFTKANVLHNALDAFISKNYQEEMDTIAAYKNVWENFSCHIGVDSDVSYKKVTVKCPVDLYLYDPSGALAASVVDEKIAAQEEHITILVAEGEKTVIYPALQPYTVKIFSRDGGEMTYRVTELLETEVLRRVETTDIPLAAGQVFEGSLPQQANAPTQDYALYTNGTLIEVDFDSDPVNPEFRPGDVDDDGRITASDARLALRRAVDLESFAEDTREYLACDVDYDGKVTAADARSILRAAVDLEVLN